jgi:cytochrome P450
MNEGVQQQAVNPGFSFNPMDPNFRLNPYPYLRPLLEAPPLVMRLFIPVAVFARYDDVILAVTDHQRFSSVPTRGLSLPSQQVFGTAANLVATDPPIHSRLRKIVSADFTPRKIREMEPRIREITNALLDRLEEKGEFDLVEDLAATLPLHVVAALLGIPVELYGNFKRWSQSLIELTSLTLGSGMTDAMRGDFIEMRSYFADEIEKRRCNPGADLISNLVAARADVEMLTADELMQFLIVLLMAGNETTTNFLGNAMLALGRHPEQMELLRKEPALLPRAIEEMLRYDGPVMALFRTAKENLSVSGAEIEKDSGVLVLLGAANRDPLHFEKPDVFDITRSPNEHLAFGDGIHFCLGAPLARLESSIAIGTMLNRFPKLRVQTDEDLEYKTSFFFRGLHSLRVAVE